jgi:hypothetical protein
MLAGAGHAPASIRAQAAHRVCEFAAARLVNERDR